MGWSSGSFGQKSNPPTERSLFRIEEDAATDPDDPVTEPVARERLQKTDLSRGVGSRGDERNVVVLPLVENRSTTTLIDRIRHADPLESAGS